MHRQGQEGERGQRLKRSPLVGALLDAIDLEDDQEQAQKREVAQKGAQAAAAVLRLAGEEASPPLDGWLMCRGGCGHVLLVGRPLRFGED